MTDDRVSDLGYARLDTDRVARTGDPEVVYGEGKSPVRATRSVSSRAYPRSDTRSSVMHRNL